VISNAFIFLNVESKADLAAGSEFTQSMPFKQSTRTAVRRISSANTSSNAFDIVSVTCGGVRLTWSNSKRRTYRKSVECVELSRPINTATVSGRRTTLPKR
jgi:hypothetical protein